MSNACPTITETEAQRFLIDTLSQGDACDVEILARAVPELWKISRYSACRSTIELYLNTRLRAIELLLSCAARQFDSRDSLFESFQQGDGAGRQDRFSQAQATNSGSRVNDSASCAKYDDFSRAKMRSGSQRDAKSCSRDNSLSAYLDQSGGANKMDSIARRHSENAVENRNESSSTGTSSGSSARSACNWTYSTESGEGDNSATTNTLLLLQGSAGAGSSYSQSNWAHHMSDGSSSRQTDLRNGSSSRSYKQRGKTDNKSDSASCSFFTASVSSLSTGTSKSNSADDSTAFRNEDAHAEGEGSSFSKADARGEVSAQGTSKSHADGDTRRDSSRWNRSLADTVKMSQRFKNLRMMHAITRENLIYVQDVGIASRPPLWTNGICQIISDGVCDIRLWMLQSRGYREACYHPQLVRPCCGTPFVEGQDRGCNCG